MRVRIVVVIAMLVGWWESTAVARADFKIGTELTDANRHRDRDVVIPTIAPMKNHFARDFDNPYRFESSEPVERATNHGMRDFSWVDVGYDDFGVHLASQQNFAGRGLADHEQLNSGVRSFRSNESEAFPLSFDRNDGRFGDGLLSASRFGSLSPSEFGSGGGLGGSGHGGHQFGGEHALPPGLGLGGGSGDSHGLGGGKPGLPTGFPPLGSDGNGGDRDIGHFGDDGQGDGSSFPPPMLAGPELPEVAPEPSSVIQFGTAAIALAFGGFWYRRKSHP